MPLPSKYVKEIHSRLAVRYGSAWKAKWAEVPQEAMEADWAQVLDGMSPAGIRKALDSLPPDFPPTATAFRALGAIAEEHKPAPQLPAPDPQGMKRVAGALGVAQAQFETPRQFMERLRRDVEAGNASRARVNHYRIAVANGYYGGETVAQVGEFRPVPQDSLPPGMRTDVAQGDYCTRCGVTGHRASHCPWGDITTNNAQTEAA